jgi:hypothetical protein
MMAEVALTDLHLDLFGSDLAAGIAGAADALEAACVARGWPSIESRTHRPSVDS